VREGMNLQEQKTVEDFHRLFYNQGAMAYASDERKTVLTATYRGYLVQKNPMDLWVYQEIIWETKPDLIVEMGTASGGTTLLLADLLDKTRKGLVLSVDIDNRLAVVPMHHRITYMVGDSLSNSVYQVVKNHVFPGCTVMVILDDDHDFEHVRDELEIYSKLVSVGQYLIVEDTNVDWPLGIGDGPGKAVHEFLEENDNFVADKSKEKFLLTWNPGGYLKRVK